MRIVEELGRPQYAFVRALRQETCYARPISYGPESVLLSPAAKRSYDDYLAHAPKHTGDEAVAEFLHRSDPFRQFVAHSHISWRRRDLTGRGVVLTVCRNPRDNFLSWVRWFGRPKAQDFFPVYGSFLGWRKANLFLYDELLTPGTVQRIGGLMGEKVGEERATKVLAAAANRSLTWTSRPSNHQSQWFPALEDFWRANRGHRLDAAYSKLSQAA